MTAPTRFARRPPRGLGGSLRSGRALAAWTAPTRFARRLARALAGTALALALAALFAAWLTPAHVADWMLSGAALCS